MSLLEPAETVAIFAKSPDVKTYATGDTIFNIDDLGSVMYGVMEGTIDLCINGQVVETIHTGDVFGEGALVQDPPTRATTAIARTDCKLAEINREHFIFLIQETPLFALQVIRSFSNRMRALKSQFR